MSEDEIKKPKNKLDNILTIILIFSIMLAIWMVIYVAVAPKVGENFTEFYILGSDGKADNYPTELKLNSSTTLLTGIVNHEYSPVNYTIQIILDKDIMVSKNLILDNNQTWENNISFNPDKVGHGKLQLLLFKENNFTTPYRELYLWVNTTT